MCVCVYVYTHTGLTRVNRLQNAPYQLGAEGAGGRRL